MTSGIDELKSGAWNVWGSSAGVVMAMLEKFDLFAVVKSIFLVETVETARIIRKSTMTRQTNQPRQQPQRRQQIGQKSIS